MKFSSILKMLDIIQEIKNKFNGNAYLYYDESDREFSISLTDVDLYWNDDFRKYASLTLDSFGNDGITIINLPEKIINSSLLYKEYNGGLMESFNKVSIVFKEIIRSVQNELDSYVAQANEQISQVANIYTVTSFKQNTASSQFDQDGQGIPRPINNVIFNMAA